MSEADGDEWTKVDGAAKQLAELMLPGDLRARIARAKRLAIVAPENIGYMPFELFPGADGEPLGNSVAIRYVPSLPVGLALMARRARRAAPAADAEEIALLCADRPGSVTGEEFPPLPVKDSTFEQLLAPYPAQRREIRSGTAADRVGFLTEIDHHPRVLQVITHGHVDQESPASLVLAGDAPLLGAAEVEGLAGPSLVVLAACSAWNGPRRRGDDGRRHLPSAFLLAGSDTVIAAESALLLEPSLALFADFHRELRAGLAPAEALTRARRTLSQKATTQRERVMAELVHAIGLADQPLFAATVDSNTLPSTDLEKPVADPGSASGADGAASTWLVLGGLVVGALGAGALFALRRRTRLIRSTESPGCGRHRPE